MSVLKSETLQEQIRNFSIIAHIDHGKSTLADRLLELTDTVTAREMKAQVLDSMDLEREKGITIKSHPVKMNVKRGGKEYEFYLIDTPGHVDFRYEVSRSLAACEGALLVVDAAQGIQAQTLANLDIAMELDLSVIPVINKIDLPAADVDKVTEQLEEVGFSKDEIFFVSAKSGQGVEALLDAIPERIPSPPGLPSSQAKALIFDAVFDAYRGAVCYLRVFEGEIKKGDTVYFLSTGEAYLVDEVGFFSPSRMPSKSLVAGQVGYLMANIKSLEQVSIGDTVGIDPSQSALEGYRKPQPMVFCGFYPIDGDQFRDLETALEKLKLNDASLIYVPESSVALGSGFRCGFLGLLHLEITQERIKREFDIELILTIPQVDYLVTLTDGSSMHLSNPQDFPDRARIEKFEEPIVHAKIYVPKDDVGAVMQLLEEKRGEFEDMKYPHPNRAVLQYTIPLNEIIIDFYDRLQSLTRGYGSYDYEPLGYRADDMVKMDILVNGTPVDAFSTILHRTKADTVGRQVVSKLKENIPRQQFACPIQAAIGTKIIARETIRSVGKNVTAKCYGGDITRKRKLWAKQKEGKKRLKTFGKVAIPQETFLKVLSLGR